MFSIPSERGHFIQYKTAMAYIDPKNDLSSPNDRFGFIVLVFYKKIKSEKQETNYCVAISSFLIVVFGDLGIA